MNVARVYALLLLFSATCVPATVWTVDITTDEQDGACVAGDCSLREAIASAVEDDEIVFGLPGSPPWTIRLQTGLGTLVVDKSLTITGPGMTSLLVSGDSDGNGTGDMRVLRVTPTGALLLTDMTLRDGRATLSSDRHGGCVLDQGDVRFVAVTFQNCKAWNGGSSGFSGLAGGSGGAVYVESGAALTIEDSVLTGNTAGTGDIGPGGDTAGPGGDGGAVSSGGFTILRRSTFDGNAAGPGGTPNGNGGAGGAYAAFPGGNLLVEDTTFSNNHSGDGHANVGFGTGADGSAGGLYVEVDATLNDVTLSGNSIGNAAAGTANVGGGLVVAAATTRLRNVTVAGNTSNGAGGGIARAGGTLIVRDSLIGDNTSTGTTSEDCTTNAAGNLVSEGYNLLTVATGCASSFVGPGDLTGVATGLGPLADNGGPTQTRALLTGSAAIDAGDPTGCDAWDPFAMTDVLMTADQRGFTRPLDGDGDTIVVCDIGAYEAPVPVTTFQLTVSLAGAGSGSVTSNPAGISCPSDCSENYADGTLVDLTATASAGSRFTGWSGDCTGTGTCSLTMSAARAVTATFVPVHTLTVAVSGSGSVTSVPPGISCPGDCTQDYDDGTSVSLTPTPDPGWVFSAWTGDCTGSGACTVSMTAARSVTATFVPLRTLTVSVVGGGTVTSVPAGINCPGDCTEDYPDGTGVVLTATPAGGFVFGGWSGDCTGTGTCNLTMSAARSVTATFVPLFTLTVSVVGGGTVTSVPAGIDCPGDCTEDYLEGTAVALTATPAPLYHLVAWSGDCSGSGPCDVTMDTARDVGATFDTMPFLDGFETGDTSRWTVAVP
jgi:CSLREA domain-containing protein